MRYFLSVLLTLAWVTVGHAAPFPRPSVRLSQVDVVLVRAELGKVSDGKLLITPLQVLHSAQPVAENTPIGLRIPDWMANHFTPKQRVLLGYIALVRERSKPGKFYRPDPSGPALLNDLGIEPALLPDRPELRAWLSRTKLKQPFSASERAQLLRWLDDPDPQVRQFAVAELSLGAQPDTTPTVRTALLKFAADLDAPVSARALVMQTALRTPDYPRAQLYKLAGQLLGQLPVEFVNDGRIEGALLAQSALEVLYDQPVAPSRGRWLHSNVPPLAEMAYLQLRRHQPKQAERALRAALQQTLLTPATRELLLRYANAPTTR